MYPGRRNASLDNVVAPLPLRDAGFRLKGYAKTRIYYFSDENTQFLTEIYGMAKCSHKSSCENLDKLISNQYIAHTDLVCFLKSRFYCGTTSTQLQYFRFLGMGNCVSRD